MMTVNSMYLKDSLKNGLQELVVRGYLEISEQGILVYAREDTKLWVEKSEGALTISYDIEPHFYMALIRSMVMDGGKHRIASKGSRLGLLHDCSRNAVPTPEMVKDLICTLVVCGYDYLELYTEETYELPDEPYFGYKRGRYSTEELKAIVAFADIFHFEMVPCIQTLAHLRRLNNWIMYYDHMDIDDVLLVGDERTYRLIRKMLRHCKDIFHTKRINIGSDEAYHLGRGKYTDIHGYKDKHELYLEHMKQVFEICKEEGLEPEFWADAFYDTDREKEEIQELFDGTQTPIVWRYRECEAEQAKEYLPKIREYAGKVQFAGGFFCWQSFAPDNQYTEKSIDALFAVALENKVDNILMTAWGNDGNECTVNAMMPSLWYAAHKLFPCEIDLSELVYRTTGYTIEEWKLCDKLNYVMPELGKQCNAAKYLLYNDFIIGLLDYNIPDHADDIYRELLPQFRPLAERDSKYSYLFESYEALCRVLVEKATFGKRLFRAYQERDREKLSSFLEELQVIRKNITAFYCVYRKQWMKENKGFGFEVFDVRLGGMIGRIETVTELLNDYLDGKIEKIYELEEERLEYFCNRFPAEHTFAPVHGDWATAYTVNLIVYS